LVPETSAADVVELCGRIEKAVAEYSMAVTGDTFTSVGVSVGSAGYPNQGETFDQIIVAADRAMYERKTDRKRFALTRPEDRRTAPGHNPQHQPHADLVSDSLIVELDETHVISSSAIN
jgi:predicted signal transduction protein with EAL and GGDEF domain